MATHQELFDSLINFQQLHNENKQLRAMNKDWDRVVLVRAADNGDVFTLTTKGGELTVAEGVPTNPQMEIVADSETLTSMFFGEISPTEPYMTGALRVKGSEADVLRLDFVTAMIWGE